MTTVVEGHGYIYVNYIKTWVKVSCNCDITAKSYFRKTWIKKGCLENGGKRRKTTLSEELRLEENLQSLNFPF